MSNSSSRGEWGRTVVVGIGMIREAELRRGRRGVREDTRLMDDPRGGLLVRVVGMVIDLLGSFSPSSLPFIAREWTRSDCRSLCNIVTAQQSDDPSPQSEMSPSSLQEMDYPDDPSLLRVIISLPLLLLPLPMSIILVVDSFLSF